MKTFKYRIGLLAAVLGFVVGCGGDDGGGVEPVNTAPTISFVFDKIAVARSTTTQLAVAVNDLDDDPLSVNWSVTRGTIAPLNSANTLVQWTVPGTVGVDSITVTVSDGTVSRTIVEGIKVGFRHTGGIAPSVFMKSRSPYIVNLASGVVLAVIDSTLIEAGTEILLETPNMVIDVSDAFIAAGTSSEPVVIQPNIRHLTCGDERGWWEGIKAVTDPDGSGQLAFDYLHVSYAQYAIRLRDSGSAQIKNCEIRCNGQNGILHEGGGLLVVEDTEVINGRFDGIGINSDTFEPDVQIDGCVVEFNGRSGIALDLMDTGQQAQIDIRYSEIRFNVEHGITLANSVFPDIHYNSFFGNGAGSQFSLNSIYLFSGYPGGAAVTQLDATCNFWGAPVTNVSTIEAFVRDQQDTGTVGTDVILEPWSNQNPITGSSTCVWP